MSYLRYPRDPSSYRKVTYYFSCVSNRVKMIMALCNTQFLNKLLNFHYVLLCRNIFAAEPDIKDII